MKQEEIDWNNVQNYYKYLIVKIRNIDNSLMGSNYWAAFEEMKQIISQITYAIETHAKDDLSYFNDNIKEIDNLILQYNVLNLQKTRKSILIKKSKLMHQINKKIYEFYTKMMSTIDKMGMLLKREEKDTRKAIYK